MRDYLDAIHSRVVLFDGGMGATLEQFDLTQEDYGGLQGKCHEALVLNRPDVIQGVHESMLEAAAEGPGPGHFHGNWSEFQPWPATGCTLLIMRTAPELACSRAHVAQLDGGYIRHYR